MTESRDLTPFLYGLAPDPLACDDARTFAARYADTARLHARLEDLLMCFSSFHKDHAGPGLAPGLGEAVGVLSTAASGLFALLSDAQRETQAGPWGTLSTARLWAVSKCSRASAHLSAQDVERLDRAYRNPHLLPAWAFDMNQAGQAREAGTLAAWWAVSAVLEAAPDLEDGEAEGQLSAVLEALARPTPAPAARPDLLLSSPGLALIGEGLALMREAQREGAQGMPGLPDFVLTVQSVQALPGGRVRVEVQGGEGYEVAWQDCVYTPLPDGGAFLSVFAGTPDAETFRLEPEEARQAQKLLGFTESSSGPVSPLN